MRTTITIDDHLLDKVRRRAAERGTTLSALIEEALRLSMSRSAPATPKFELVTFEGDGVQPGVVLDRTSTLAADEDIERYRGRG